jgi:NAD(P)-dependent dehydrogenase (short-subunit alcohol dehydrogenase family)
LAGLGSTIVGVGRNAERCAAAEAAIWKAIAPGSEVAMIRGDLSSMDDTERVAAEISQRFDRIDVLLNNAGGVVPNESSPPRETKPRSPATISRHFCLRTH